MPGTVLLDLGGGRSLCVDDVGDPTGTPLVFVHGTPDSRRGRHPDDTVAAGLGVRLLAVDRPGFGGSTPDPAATPASFGTDLGQALDALAVERCALLAWSAGAVWALGAAAVLGERVTRVGVAAGLVPAEAYDDPAVKAAAPSARLAVLETAADLSAAEAAALIAPMLVPDPLTLELAEEHFAATHDAATLAELDAVPGATALMAATMLDAVQQGPAGLVRDIEVQATPDLVALAAVNCPVLLWYGAADVSVPPAFGEWFAAQLPNAELHVIPNASHAWVLPHWPEVLTALTR